MIQLTFQPAFDVFHTCFRMLRLRSLMSLDTAWNYDQLRIADYYLLFFFRLEYVRLNNKHRAIKKLAKDDKSGVRYENQPDDKLIFDRMAPIQLAAMSTLVESGYFSLKEFDVKLVRPLENRLAEALESRIDEINLADKEILQAINVLVTEYGLLGKDGLKARTGLLEYRYDAVF